MMFLDLLGNEIKVDDIVAVAATNMQSGEMRIGRVDELIPHSLKVRVEWYRGFTSYGNKKKTMIGGYQERVEVGKDGQGFPVWKASGNISMENFLVLDKAVDFQP